MGGDRGHTCSYCPACTFAARILAGLICLKLTISSAVPPIRQVRSVQCQAKLSYLEGTDTFSKDQRGVLTFQRISKRLRCISAYSALSILTAKFSFRVESMMTLSAPTSMVML